MTSSAALTNRISRLSEAPLGDGFVPTINCRPPRHSRRGSGHIRRTAMGLGDKIHNAAETPRQEQGSRR